MNDEWKGVYDDTYVIDDGHDELMLGFEFDPEHGHIVHVTRAAAEKLAFELLRSVRFATAGTEANVIYVETAAPRPSPEEPTR